MIKSILAIAVGFIAIALLSLGADWALRAAVPHAFSQSGRTESPVVLCLVLAYSAGLAVSGSYLTARLAPHKPKKHALILGAIGFALSIFATISNWQSAPVWYHVIALALILPMAWVGGEVRERQQRNKENS